MATVANQDEEENPTGPITVTGESGQDSGGGGAGAGAATVSPVQQNAAAQNQSGYTDVASYLNANKAGAEKLGSDVASNLDKKYGSTKQGVQTSADQFNSSVNSGYVPENSDLIAQVAADPNAAANDPNQLAAYQAQLNNSYKGPTTWGDLGTQQGKVNEANQYADLSKTPGGLNVYAGEVEGANGGPQSQGINQLDTLLLGGNENAVGQVKGAASKYGDLNDFINQMNTQGLGNVQAATTAAQKGSQDALNAFTGENGTLTNLNNTVNNNASTALKTAQDRQAALQQALSGIYSQPVDESTSTIQGYGGSSNPWYNTTNYNVNDTMTPDTLKELGITADQWQALQGAMKAAGTSDYKTGHNFGAGSQTAQINLNDFLSSQDPTQAITAATTATPEQYAQMEAIQKLLGDKTPQGAALNPLNKQYAGTAPTTSTQFNYQDALDYANQVDSLTSQEAQEMANALTSGADAAHKASKGGGFLSKLKDVAGKVFPVHKIANDVVLKQGKKLAK